MNTDKIKKVCEISALVLLLLSLAIGGWYLGAFSCDKGYTNDITWKGTVENISISDDKEHVYLTIKEVFGSMRDLTVKADEKCKVYGSEEKILATDINVGDVIETTKGKITVISKNNP
jgi:hypothetical protein